MKIGTALVSIKSLYLEAGPLIYFVEENLRYIDRMDVIMMHIHEAELQGFTSVITLTEVLALPIRSSRHDLETAYREILVNNPSVRLINVNSEIAERAARLRAKYNLRTPDALHIGTALDVRCYAFLTNDSGLKRVSEIKILMLDDLELDDKTG